MAQNVKEDRDPTQEPLEEPGQPTAGQPTEDGLPKTQEELDALIEKRLARERRKMAKQQVTQQPEGQPGPQEPQQPAADKTALDAANRELLIARAQLDAYREGVLPAAVEDAVLLAVMQAEKSGEADEDGVRDALKEVLKRHPEWKPQKKEPQKSGFRVGVDSAAGGGKPGAGGKALPSGKVIF